MTVRGLEKKRARLPVFPKAGGLPLKLQRVSPEAFARGSWLTHTPLQVGFRQAARELPAGKALFSLPDLSCRSVSALCADAGAESPPG